MARKRKPPSSEDDSDKDEVESYSEEVGSESVSEYEEEKESSSSDEDEASSDESKKENLRRLLEPFGKDQIIDLLKEAAAKDPKILAKIVKVADSDPTHRKIFVHGLSWDATSEQLLQAFKPFGEIEDSKLITDKNTGRAKGYAFVLFKTGAAAKKALKVPQKQIGSRMVSCQLAAAGPPAGPGAAVEGGSRKIYIGNVGPHVSPEKLREFFRRYGEIEDAPIGLDFVTNKFKGFAVITYKSPEGFKKAMEEPIKVFENIQLHCKKFVEKEKQNNAAAGQVSASGVIPAMTGYAGLGMNPGILGTNFGAGGGFMPQNLGVGLAANPMMAAGYKPAALMAPVAGMGGNYGVMGSYGAQAALQGLGSYPNSQLGQPSVGTPAPTTTATWATESDASPVKKHVSYFRR